MEDGVFLKIIERLKEEKIDVEKFILHLNGEPFTDPNLLKRIRNLDEIFPGVPIWFTTNFSLPDRDMIDCLLETNLHTITVSLNTLDKDEYRKITGGVSYEKVLNNLDYLLKRKNELQSSLHVRVSIVDTGNKEMVERFCDAYEKKAEVRVIRLGQWVGEKKPNNLIKRKGSESFSCPDLNAQICILSNGDYALCCFDSEGVIGLNIMSTPILQAFYSGVYETTRKQQKTGGSVGTFCENCSFVE